jgi:small redox-active disulfide protein 2
MRIEILGTGCPKCRQLYDNVEQAIHGAGMAAEIVKVTEIEEIIKRGVMLTPALSINGVVKSMGKVPGVEEIKSLLQNGK